MLAGFAVELEEKEEEQRNANNSQLLFVFVSFFFSPPQLPVTHFYAVSRLTLRLWSLDIYEIYITSFTGSITIYSLLTNVTSLILLRSHVKVTKSKQFERVWILEACENSRQQVVRTSSMSWSLIKMIELTFSLDEVVHSPRFEVSRLKLKY